MDVNNNNVLNSIVKNHYPSFTETESTCQFSRSPLRVLTDLDKLENGYINKNELAQPLEDLQKEEESKYTNENDSIKLINNNNTTKNIICINSKKICFTIIFLSLSFMIIIILSLFY
jgi:hypothetical protein